MKKYIIVAGVILLVCFAAKKGYDYGVKEEAENQKQIIATRYYGILYPELDSINALFEQWFAQLEKGEDTTETEQALLFSIRKIQTCIEGDNTGYMNLTGRLLHADSEYQPEGSVEVFFNRLCCFFDDGYYEGRYVAGDKRNWNHYMADGVMSDTEYEFIQGCYGITKKLFVNLLPYAEEPVTYEQLRNILWLNDENGESEIFRFVKKYGKLN